MQRSEEVRDLQLSLKAIRSRLNQDLDEVEARLARLAPDVEQTDLPKNPAARASLYESVLSQI